jgi:dTDP-4-dehydrorhamnose reductase
MSKYLGEKVINQSSDLIIRISFPYGHISPVKKDFVWKLHDLIASRDEVSLISDQTITPTFIDDVVMGIDFLLEHEICGIVHLTGSSSHSPKEISEKIKQTFGLSTSIGESKLEDVYAGKAARPLQSIMKNDKLKNLGFVPKTFDQGLDLIK